ncbi:MAG: ATP synthase F0 subunit B, partial [Acidobacteria bacterium]|nr:ATP synthase F0 subunit B [Acidobacteriota bacterium]
HAVSGDSSWGKFLHFWNTYFNYPGFELWRFINLSVFVAILIYLLKKPLTQAFKTRRETIRAELIRAEEERQAALAQLTATEAKLARLDAESNEVLEKARREAEAEKMRIAREAEEEANKLRGQAESEIVRKSKLVQMQLRRFSAEESIRLAEEKIKHQINPEKDARLVKQSIQSIGGLS